MTRVVHYAHDLALCLLLALALLLLVNAIGGGCAMPAGEGGPTTQPTPQEVQDVVTVGTAVASSAAYLFIPPPWGELVAIVMTAVSGWFIKQRLSKSRK